MISKESLCDIQLQSRFFYWFSVPIPSLTTGDTGEVQQATESHLTRLLLPLGVRQRISSGSQRSLDEGRAHPGGCDHNPVSHSRVVPDLRCVTPLRKRGVDCSLSRRCHPCRSGDRPGRHRCRASPRNASKYPLECGPMSEELPTLKPPRLDRRNLLVR